jgi:S-adenosylmethionine:tRNA ribosyltransferase-isomerase
VRLLDASEPVEARGLARDQVRLLVGRRSGGVSHHAFTELPALLREGDVLVVNTSATLPAAVPTVAPGELAVHFSTPHPDAGPPLPSTGAVSAGSVFSWAAGPGGDGSVWLVELRRNYRPYPHGAAGQRLDLAGGGTVTLRAPYSTGRLWVADLDLGGLGVVDYLHRHGTPIRYGYVPHAWGLEYYQTVFAREPGSAEMPSAGRPFTDALVTRLVTAGIAVAPVVLHTGVASPEAHERPYPERFSVPAATAATVNHRRARGGRVIAVGTTVVRALESAVLESAALKSGARAAGPEKLVLGGSARSAPGSVRAVSGWTNLVVTPERGVRVVDALLTGLHEPEASHLDLLAAVAGRPLLDACYAEARAEGYRWHEFGDLNLLLP